MAEQKPEVKRRSRKTIVKPPTLNGDEVEKQSEAINGAEPTNGEPVEKKKIVRRVGIQSIADDLKKINEIIETAIEKKKDNGKDGVADLKKIQAISQRALDKAYKMYPKTQRVSVPRQNQASQLNRPQPISEELRDFLNEGNPTPFDKDAQFTRGEITRAISVYVNLKEDEKREEILKWSFLNKEHRNLQDQVNKKIIMLDERLSALLHYPQYVEDVKAGKFQRSVFNKETEQYEKVTMTDEQMYYKTLQRLISHHLLKPAVKQ